MRIKAGVKIFRALFLAVLVLLPSMSLESISILRTIDSPEFANNLSAVMTTRNVSANWIFNVSDWYQVVEVSSDNERVFCGGCNSGLLYCLYLENGSEIWRSGQTLGSIVSLSESPNHKYVSVGSENGNVCILNASNGHVLWNYNASGGVMSSVVFSPDNNFVFAGNANGNVFCLNVSGELVWGQSLHGQVYSLESSKKGEFLIAGQGASMVTCLSSLNGSINWNFKTEGTWNSSKATISSDDKLILVASTNNNVYLLNASTGYKLWNFAAESWIKSVAFSPYNDKVGAITTDAEVYCFQSSNGQILWNRTFSGQEGYVMWSSTSTLEFSPYGSKMVVGGINKVFVLSVTDGSTIGEYSALQDSSGDVGRICSLGVSTNGKYILIGTYYNGVHCVPIPSAVWTVNANGPADFRTIQEAINAASPGDTISVRNGTYFENVDVNKTVSIIGEDKWTTIIDGGKNGVVVSLEANSSTISDFTMENSGNSDYDCGISVRSSGNNLRNNIVKSDENGIIVQPGSDDNILTNNSVSASEVYGIHLYYSNRTILNGNTVTKCYDGIIMEFCSNTTLRSNTIFDNVWNFGVGGVELPYFIHDIDTSNRVEGKPIQYLINVKNIVIDSTWDVGYLCIVNSTNVTVKDLTLNTPSWHGIQFAYTTNSRIEDVTISETSYAIEFVYSSNNTIMNNSIFNRNGIRLSNSNDNIIVSNNISRNDFAVSLFYSSDNTIMNNNLNDNWRGLFLYSSNNRIYHNNFINNGVQVFTDKNVYANIWDNGYVSGGNYWSDYNGTDSHGGPYQNETGYDWIGDSPYIIDQNNIDRYPLMTPFSSDIEEMRIAYRNLLLRFTETRSELDALNSTLAGLIDRIAGMQSQFDSLNETVLSMASQIRTLSTTVAYLQQQIIALNTTVNSTQSGLQAQISTLNAQVLELQGRLESLNATLQSSKNTEQDNYNSLTNRLNTILNMTYALAVATTVLVIAVAYLIVRRPKPKQ